MKKVLVLFSMMALASSASFAYIQESSNIDSLRRQGYSESMLKVVDVVKYKNQGDNGNYQRVFNKKPNTGYSALKIYWDPYQDDGDFGSHQINFTNTWMGDETPYSSRLDGNVENL